MAVAQILTLLESFSKMRSINQKMRAFVELDVIADAISRIQATYKPALIEKKVYECFPEYESKIEYLAPKSQSHINPKLLKYLLSKNRIDDLLSIVSISKSELAKLEDGEALIKKYLVADEDTKANVRVAKMTKEELKLHSVKN